MTTHNARRRVMVVFFTHVRSNKQIVWGDDPIAIANFLFPHYFEEEPYLSVLLLLVPCTPPTAPVSRSFGLRSSYEIAIFDTELKTQEQISSTAEPIQTLHVKLLSQ